MRTIEEALTVELDELDECLQGLLKNLAECINKIDFNDAIQDRSTSMKNALQVSTEKLSKFNWIPKTRDGQAPFGLDAKYVCNKSCQSLHILNLVICLNNREAIGTNFLKLEIASLSAIRSFQETEIYDSNILGVLLAFDRDVLSIGKWDNSYADAGEYSAGYRKFYKPFLKANILSLRVHS